MTATDAAPAALYQAERPTPKFIQITGSYYTLYALDEKGDVWTMGSGSFIDPRTASVWAWQKVDMSRVDPQEIYRQHAAADEATKP